MRMPPYMRDSDENPLSLSWLQYDTLMRLVDLLSPPPAHGEAASGGREQESTAPDGSAETKGSGQ